MSPRLELVLPCYNEARGLEVLIDRVIVAAKDGGFSPGSFRLIVVENGSRDESAAVLASLSDDPERAPWFRVVHVAQNRGYGFGLCSGLSTTTAPVVAWSHADLQCDPADVFRAYAILERESLPRMVVRGVRRGRAGRDRFVSWVFKSCARVILGLRMSEINAQPKVFHRAVIDAADFQPPRGFAFDLYVLYRMKKAGYAEKTIPVLFPPRVHGVSNWSAHFAGRYRTILGLLGYMIRLARLEGRV